MSIDPGEIRAEPHTEIGSLLQRDASLLIERWSRRAVQEQPHARRVHHPVLVDHLHDLIQAVGRSLAESDEIATSQHCLPAIIHGEQRWETGWSLPEVVRDYGILRLVIIDYLEEVLVYAPSPRAVMAIGLALDDAISASVTMYVNSRDCHQKEVDEQQAERDRQFQERLRRKTEALEEADRRKNEFMAVLGHEMRNPLAPLWHAVDLLEPQAAADPDLAQIREITKRQVQQLTRLADDLLDIARIAQGKVELRKEPVDLVVVVAQCAQAAAPRIEARGQRFDVAIAREPLWLEADPTRLAQILDNLLSNATKYTEHGGLISLSVDRDGCHAVVRVRDSGVGIPCDLLPHIFELFTQGEWSPGNSQGGMGIGLALVRRLVELHGGTITATSPGLNQGSELELRLPLSVAQPPSSTLVPPPQRAAAPPHIGQATRRVLIVDDNEDVAATLRMLLTVDRHEVRVVHDGSAALDAASDFLPEVIILDIGLPRMDGYEVARRLRERPETKQALLIALTGYGYDDDRRRSTAAGFDAHLVKPVAPATLRALLARPS